MPARIKFTDKEIKDLRISLECQYDINKRMNLDNGAIEDLIIKLDFYSKDHKEQDRIRAKERYYSKKKTMFNETLTIQ